MSLDYVSPLHLCLHPGESTPSLVTRLAHATSPQWHNVLRELAGSDYAVASTAIHTKLCVRIAELAGLDEMDVLRGMVRRFRICQPTSRLGNLPSSTTTS